MSNPHATKKISKAELERLFKDYPNFPFGGNPNNMSNNINLDQLNISSVHRAMFSQWLLNNGYNIGETVSYYNSKYDDFLTAIKNDSKFTCYDFGIITDSTLFFNDKLVIVVGRTESIVSIFAKGIDGYKDIENFFQTYRSYIRSHETGQVEVRFFYSKNNEVREDYVDLPEHKDIIYSELYPDIDINLLNKEFNESRERILILYGEPGVGKTTFLKYMLYASFYKKIAYVKDQKVMDSGEFWARITSSETDLLIFDDLDNALESRKDNENNFLNNLLSYSDGMISRSCKIVITTNQPIHKIDDALTRAGRCFDFLVLKALTRDQALDIWTNILKMGSSIFTDHFGDAENITQAEIMSAFNNLSSQSQCRSYMKNGPKNYSVNQKIRDMGMSQTAGGFRRV